MLGTCLVIPQDSEFLADKHTPQGTWTNRFTYPSSDPTKVYIIAQNEEGKWWSCPCKRWIYKRNCRHLRELGLPGDKVPLEVLAVTYPATTGRVINVSASIMGKQLIDFGDTSHIRKIDLDDNVI